VSVNGTSTSFTVDSDSSITARLPAGASSGPIAVQVAGGGTLTSTSSFVVTTVVPDQAVAYQINPAHDGVQTDAGLRPPFALHWTTNFANPASYPLIAGGKVFVTVSMYPAYGGNLYALDQTDGHVVWSQTISGTYSFSAAAYDAGKVFVLNFNGSLRAFDAGTGAQLWIRQLPGQYSFTSPPVAAHGVVYTGGAGIGGTMYAVDEFNGNVLATQSVANGDHSSPSLSDTGVFASYACNQAYGFSQTNLAPLWHYSTYCSGGGGKTTVYSSGNVFTRDFTGNLVLGAATGTLLSSFAGTSAPAVDATTVYGLSPPTLYAQNRDGGQTRWTFSGDGNLTTAPLVLRTATADFVVVGSTSGALYALDATTGAPVWSTNVGGSLAGPDEQNATILGGIAAGQGLLVVPNGNSVSAYAAEGRCRPTRRRRRSRFRPRSPSRPPDRREPRSRTRRPQATRTMRQRRSRSRVHPLPAPRSRSGRPPSRATRTTPPATTPPRRRSPSPSGTRRLPRSRLRRTARSMPRARRAPR